MPRLAGDGLIVGLVPRRRSEWNLAGSLVMMYVAAHVVYALIRVLMF